MPSKTSKERRPAGIHGQTWGSLPAIHQLRTGTDLVSVLFLSTESLTLVSQKMCVVVYPKVDGDLGTEEAASEMEEQQKPIFQPTPAKDQDSEEQP